MINEYINNVDEDKKEVFVKTLEAIRRGIPKEYEEILQYDTPSFVVPLSLYPEGYKPGGGIELPFISVAARKGYLSIYHLALKSFPDIYSWFEKELKETYNQKINMGVSCLKFKYTDNIPYDLIEKLASKISVEEYILFYKNSSKKKKL